jgi:DNA-binding protein HU-beta
MNKAELVNEVHRLLGDGTSKAAAERAADSVLQAIRRGLRKDAEVHLAGFGTFTVAQRSARQGFNPHTRKPMKIPAMKLVRFRAGSSLRAAR